MYSCHDGNLLRILTFKLMNAHVYYLALKILDPKLQMVFTTAQWQEDCENGWQNLSRGEQLHSLKWASDFFDYLHAISRWLDDIFSSLPFFSFIRFQVAQVHVFSVFSLDKCVEPFFLYRLFFGWSHQCATYNLQSQFLFFIYTERIFFVCWHWWKQVFRNWKNKKAPWRPGAHADLSYWIDKVLFSVLGLGEKTWPSKTRSFC